VLSFSGNTARKPDERLLQAARVIGSQIGQFLQRKQAEQSLRESEEHFRQTFELAGSGVAQVDLHGRFARVGRKLVDEAGDEELHGRRGGRLCAR